MKKNLSFLLLGLAIVVSVLILTQARAQTENIQFPIPELGNCTDKAACKAYCDDPAHVEACINFAQSHQMMTQEEAAMAKKMALGQIQGPGGCTTKDKCEAYCNDTDHIEECVSFAEKNNLMSQKELDEAKKVSNAIKQGIKPPACGNKKACDSYCGAPEHMEECIKFAIKAGLIGEQEKADAEKMLSAIKQGVKPPACGGKEQCDIYCSEEAHFEECGNFAVAAGFISPQDYEMMKKTQGKGPGGCKGKECETFCKDPANEQTCLEFAKQNGLIPADQLKQMEEGNGKFKDSLNNAPPKIKECLIAAFGDLDKVAPSAKNGQIMAQCYQKFPPDSVTGPGGCKSPEECDAYCKNNPNECRSFGSGSQQNSNQGQGNPGQYQGNFEQRQGPSNNANQQNQMPPSNGQGGPYIPPGDMQPGAQPGQSYLPPGQQPPPQQQQPSSSQQQMPQQQLQQQLPQQQIVPSSSPQSSRSGINAFMGLMLNALIGWLK